MQNIRANISNDARVPLTVLPLSQQAFIKNYEAREQHSSTRGDLKVYITATPSYVAPGVGNVFEGSLNAATGIPEPEAPALPLSDIPVTLPLDAVTRALIVTPSLPSASPQTASLRSTSASMPERAALLAAAARRHGLNQLWIELTEDKDETQTLAAFVAAGKKNGLAVVAVLRLLRRKRNDRQAVALGGDIWDRNLLDKSADAPDAGPAPIFWGDWLCPDVPANRVSVQERLRDIAAVPGLYGIALEDTAAPGYRDMGAQSKPFADFDSRDFGYTPSMRLAFLRRADFDPVDLTPHIDRHLFADLSLPFFADVVGSFQLDADTFEWKQQGAPTSAQEWNAFRFQTNAALLADLYAFAQAKFPTLPLWMRHTPTADGWWGRWNKPDPFPKVPSALAEDTAEQARHVAARPLLLNLPYEGSYTPDTVPTGPQDFALRVKQRLQARKQGWDGVVLDLSALPLSQVFRALEGLEAVKQQ